MPTDQGFSTLMLLAHEPNHYLVGGCPWHCRMLGSAPGLYPLDTNRVPLPSQVVTTRMSPDIV